MGKLNIFFDLDGTILNVSERIYRVYFDILKKHKKKVLVKEKYLKLKREKKSIEEILRKTEAEDISQIYKKEWLKNIEKEEYLNLDRIPVFKKKILVDLKKRNNLILVTSRKKKKLLYKQIKEKEISKIFQSVIIVPERWKDKAELLEKEIKNKNYILISDTESYILAGRKLKIKTVAVCDGVRSKKFLKKFSPKFLIKDIKDLPKIINSKN